MKRLILILLLLCHSNLYAQAVPSLPELTVAQPGDLLYVVRPTDAQPDRKMTVENMRVFMSQGLNAACSGAARVATINAGITTCKSASIDRVTATNLPPSPTTGDVVVVTDALNGSVCATPGGTSNNTCQWNGSTWVVVGGAGGVGGVNEASPYNWSGQHTFTIDPTVNGSPMCLLNGTNCPAAGNESDPVVGAISGVPKGDGKGAISAANATDLPYTPAGTIASNTTGGAIAELDSETQTALAGKQPVDADLTALAANATAGFWAAATNVARSMATADANNITITNPAGVAGPPTWAIGPNVALTTRSFTVGNFDYDFTSAASFTFPRATGAAPTASGRCAYDNTANRLKCGFNGATVTLAITSEIQPLNAILTSLGGLTGLAGEMVYWTAANTLARTTGLSTPCPATGTQAWNTSANGTWVCGPLSVGLTGTMTANYVPMGVTAGTLTPSVISQTGGNVTIGGGLLVNCAADCVAFDLSAYAGHVPYSITVPYVGASASVAMTTGALVNGEVVKVGAAGQLVSGGAAGAGDVTLNGVQELTNKTIKNADAGGTGNVVTIGIAPYWDAESLTLPSGSTCTQAAVAAINSGPSGNFVNCTDAATSIFEGRITLKQAVATVNFHLTVNDVDSSSQHFAGNFQAMCRNNNTAVGAWAGTVQAVDITMATANNNYTGTTPTLTPNGTCSAGATLFWNFTVDTTPFTDGGNARVIGVLMKQVS